MKGKHFTSQCVLLVIILLVFAGYLIFRYTKKDQKGPEITIAEEVPEISVADDLEKYLQGVTAWDDRDGDVTERMVLESVYGITSKHEASVTYAAFDRAGNVTKATRQVRFMDYHSPRFLLHSALVFPENAGVDLMDYIGAEDVFDGDVVRWVRATLLSNTSSLADVGTHDVRLRVTNSLGDTSELVLPVEVHEPGKYNAKLELDAYLVYLPLGASFDAGDYLVSMNYAGRKHTVQETGAGMTVSIDGTVDTSTPGLYPVTYTVCCVDADITYTAYSRLFVVVEE